MRDEVGLPLSVGIARTKVLAKMASREAKPDGIFTVEPAREREFLHALPVERVWGIGDKTAAKLHREGIATVGQVAALSENAMIGLLGKASGRHVFALATNRERRPQVRSRGRRSLGSQSGFGLRRVNAPEALDPILLSIVDRVTRRLRSGELDRPHRDPQAALRRLQAREPLDDARAADGERRDACSRRPAACSRRRCPRSASAA